MPITKVGNCSIALDFDFKHLPYAKKPDAVIDATKNPQLLGEMFGDMDNDGSYNFDHLNFLHWNNFAWCFYKLLPGTLVPIHEDHFINYMKYYRLSDKAKISRCLLFLEDWKPGHYFEAEARSFIKWKAMDYVVWTHDTPHLGMNAGREDRYTLQITGTTE